MGECKIEGNYAFPSFYQNNTLGPFTEKPVSFEGTIFDSKNWVNGEYISPEQQCMNSDVIAYQKYMEEKSNPSHQEPHQKTPHQQPDVPEVKPETSTPTGSDSPQKTRRNRKHHLRHGRTADNPQPTPKGKVRRKMGEKLATPKSGATGKFRGNPPILNAGETAKFKGLAKVSKLFRGGRGWAAAILALLAIGTTTTICAYNSGKKSGSEEAVHFADTESSSSGGSSSNSNSNSTESTGSGGSDSSKSSKSSRGGEPNWEAIQRVWAA